MKENINDLMTKNHIEFAELAEKLSISKQTLTRKLNGKTDWTYQEMMILSELFHIEDPAEFFYS